MIYDFNIQASPLSPPDKRNPFLLGLLQSLLSPLQHAHDAFFTTYYGNDLSKRILYNGQRIVLEYALNMRFGGTFVQPLTVDESDRLSPPSNYIYTSKVGSVDCSFLIGLTDLFTPGSSYGSSTIGLTESYGNNFQLTYRDSIGVNKSLIYVNNFTINIPTALYNAIPNATTDIQRNNIINQFVNTYIPCGDHFTINVI